MSRNSQRDSEQDYESQSKVRLDAWLWATRFFKTRQLAHAAVEGGKVYINRDRVKPGRPVKIGETISIQSPRGNFEVVVTGLSSKRVSAPIAESMYEETKESKERREQLKEFNRLSHSIAPDERPNSQNRQLLRRIKEG